jgi:uncharacterized protein (DUF4415 family)
MNGKRPALGSDLAKADVLPITPEQYEEVPELTEQWFDHAELHVGGAKVGRPKAAVRKLAVKLRLDPDVVQAFRKTGPGWQTRMNAALRRAARRITRKTSAKGRGLTRRKAKALVRLLGRSRAKRPRLRRRS